MITTIEDVYAVLRDHHLRPRLDAERRTISIAKNPRESIVLAWNGYMFDVVRRAEHRPAPGAMPAGPSETIVARLEPTTPGAVAAMYIDWAGGSHA